MKNNKFKFKNMKEQQKLPKITSLSEDQIRSILKRWGHVGQHFMSWCAAIQFACHSNESLDSLKKNTIEEIGEKHAHLLLQSLISCKSFPDETSYNDVSREFSVISKYLINCIEKKDEQGALSLILLMETAGGTEPMIWIRNAIKSLGGDSSYADLHLECDGGTEGHAAMFNALVVKNDITASTIWNDLLFKVFSI